jgi:hypothetical protein
LRVWRARLALEFFISSSAGHKPGLELESGC